MVADPRHGIAVAGHFPASEMLAADRESKDGGSGGTALGEVGRHFLGVVEFVGDSWPETRVLVGSSLWAASIEDRAFSGLGDIVDVCGGI